MARPLTFVLTLLAAAALQLAPAACGSEEDGLKVAIHMETPSSPPVFAGQRDLTTKPGYTVRLTRGYLSYQSAELVSCTEVSWRPAGWIREARTHGESSPKVLGFSRVESLLAAPGGVETIGELAPPPGRYCAVKLGLRAADEDASGLPEDGVMKGKSVHVEGFYTHPLGDVEMPFKGSTSASAEVTCPLGLLELSSEGRREATISLALALEHLLDDGEGLNSRTEEDIGRGVLKNLAAAQGARVP